MLKQSNILDPIQDKLDQRVFNHKTPKPSVVQFIKRVYYRAFAQKFGVDPEDVSRYIHLVLTGSLTTYQYSDTSDMDVSVFPNWDRFQEDLGIDPQEARRKLVEMNIDHLDGTHIPGSPHPLQFFTVAQGITPDVQFQAGLRSGYDLDSGHWVIPPEESRSKDIQKQFPDVFERASEIAGKMTLMLDSGDFKRAIELWKQVHEKRQLEQRAGGGDYSEGNIVYKWLVHEGIVDRLRKEVGLQIATHVKQTDIADVWHDESPYQLPPDVQQYYMSIGECPYCQHSLRKDMNGQLYCEYCGWQPKMAAPNVDPGLWEVVMRALHHYPSMGILPTEVDEQTLLNRIVTEVYDAYPPDKRPSQDELEWAIGLALSSWNNAKGEGEQPQIEEMNATPMPSGLGEKIPDWNKPETQRYMGQPRNIGWMRWNSVEDSNLSQYEPIYNQLTQRFLPYDPFENQVAQDDPMYELALEELYDDGRWWKVAGIQGVGTGVWEDGEVGAADGIISHSEIINEFASYDRAEWEQQKDLIFIGWLGKPALKNGDQPFQLIIREYVQGKINPEWVAQSIGLKPGEYVAHVEETPARLGTKIANTMQILYDFEKDHIILGSKSSDVHSKLIGSYDTDTNTATLFEAEKQWVNPTYFRRLWNYSYPAYPLRTVQFQQGDEAQDLKPKDHPYHERHWANWWENPDKADWQHGMCDTYAKAMIDMYPHLRLGTLNGGQHFFAHDDQYAYDSLGRHQLPYHGIANTMEPSMEEDPNDWFEFYPYGENGTKEDYERAKTLIAQQHPWLREHTAEAAPNLPDIPTALSVNEVNALQSLAAGKIVLEIGSLLGFSTINLARVAEKVYSVDPHMGYPASDPRPTYDTFVNNLENYNVRDKVDINVGTDQEIFPSLSPTFFDLVFIDATGLYEDTKRIIQSSIPLVKPGGVIAVHDYGHPDWPGAGEAIDEMAQHLGQPTIIDTLAIFPVIGGQ